MILFVVGTVPNLEIEMKSPNIKFSNLTIEKTGNNIGLLNKDNVKGWIGKSAHEGAISRPCFYVITDLPDDENIGDITFTMRGIFERILFSFWLVKDNSLHSDLIIGVTGSEVNINKSPRTFTTAEGLYGINTYTFEEIKEAESWFNKIREAQQQNKERNKPNKKESTRSQIGNFITQTEKNLTLNTRLDRSLRFVLEARGQSFLPAKITFYISALESLLSNSKNEVVAQVADRSAIIAGKDFEDKLRINKLITIAYDYRSSYIHGANRSEKELRKMIRPYSTVEEVSVEVDSIMRKIITRFLTDLNHVIDMTDKEFKVWIKELLYN